MLEAGITFGGTYRLEKPLGKGGMGEVWLARHTLLDEPRAIKIMLGAFASDQSLRERFIRGEARNALRLGAHPHIVRVYELGLHEDMPYIVMEFVPGSPSGADLKELLHFKGKLSPEETGEFLDQLASALDLAHRQGLVHRDIKPANILLAGFGGQGSGTSSRTGNPQPPAPNLQPLIAKLNDFGLTKDLEADTELTATGFSMGTPAYMSPEQAQGHSEPRSDIYSLGAVVYEMLTGRTPFTGNITALLVQHATVPPPPLQQFEANVPPDIGEVVLKALAKRPEDRYNSALEFARAYQTALKAWQERESLPTMLLQTGPLPAPELKPLTAQPITPGRATVASPAAATVKNEPVAAPVIDLGLKPTRPSGTVTFLFTDIEGSTKLWEQYPKAMEAALARHDAIMRQAIETESGYVFKTMGDAFCAAFTTAPEALAAALAAQITLHEQEQAPGGWGFDEPETIAPTPDPQPPTPALRVRMALHTDTAEERDGDYFGPPLNRIARLLATGYGGQTLLSRATQELVRDHLPEGVSLKNMGEHRLKDLSRLENIFQMVAPDLPAEFPPLKTLENASTNLPTQPTPLIGRDKEVAEGCALLRREEVRLLTVTGPGGTGKTRLALQVAADLLEEYENGVYFVSLAAITDPDLVAATIAETLGVKEEGQSIAESLKTYLHHKQILLVLDNFEQVVEAGTLLGELLEASKRLKLIVTSRAALRVYGEHEYSVPPLALPNPASFYSRNGTPKMPLEILSQYAAVALFIQRAQAAKPDFQITNENAPAVAEICVRLDGLPLAIELAAARIKLLTPQSMLAKLNSRLKLLTGGSRNLPARQQTLRGAIDWSYDLLEPGEKQLFARLAIFVGGWTLEAAEAVCNPEGEMEIDVMDGIGSLLDKSLLRQQEDAEGESRFAMLETLREYGLERLGESGDEAALKEAHAQFFLTLAEEAEPKLGGGQQGAWLTRLETEHDNFRAALSWRLEKSEVRSQKSEEFSSSFIPHSSSLQSPHPSSLIPHPSEIALRMGSALSRFWLVRGYFSEGRRWLEKALSEEGFSNPRLRAKALNALATLARSQGDYARALEWQQESLAASRELGDKAGIATALNTLAGIAYSQGDYSQAKNWFEESLALRRELKDKAGIAGSLNNLGIIAQLAGDYAQARTHYTESLTLRRGFQDKQGMANALSNLGVMARDQGDYAQARAHYEESLTLRREVGDKRGVALSLQNIGQISRLQEDYAGAKAYYEESLSLRRELEDRQGVANLLMNLGVIAARQGDYAGATELYRESLGLFREMEDKKGVASALHNLADAARAQEDFAAASDLYRESLNLFRVLENRQGMLEGLQGIALVISRQGEAERAILLWGAAEALRESLGTALAPDEQADHARHLAELRSPLEATAFEAVRAEGHGLTLAQVLTLALSA